MAINLYVRLARSRSRSAYTLAAKQKLVELQNEARNEHRGVQDKLTSSLAQQPDQVHHIFDDYRALARKYRRVPEVGKEIQYRLRRYRRDPACAVILNEPSAAKLFTEGGNLERQQQLCCAYHCYREAAKLLPAPSAVAARDRLAEMEQDARLVADAKQCADLQWCHKKFLQAERLVEHYPDKARILFIAIVSRSTADTVVHRAASERLAKLK